MINTNNSLVINLKNVLFTEHEKKLLDYKKLHVSVFRYSTGVEAVRVKNARGEFVILPFLGQQIWKIEFDNRPLAMTSVFEEPQQGKSYLENYGAFLLHCGLTGMGNPGRDDTHPLHGELPAAEYAEAYIIMKTDPVLSLGIGGNFRYKKAFANNYSFEPVVWIDENTSVISMEVTIENKKNSDLEYMYLTHINFNFIEEG